MQWLCFKRSQGVWAKELNLPNILEKTRVTDMYLGILVVYKCFYEKRCTRMLRLKQKSDLLFKQLYIWPLVSLLLLGICRRAPWGHFTLLAPYFPLMLTCVAFNFYIKYTSDNLASANSEFPPCHSSRVSRSRISRVHHSLIMI